MNWIRQMSRNKLMKNFMVLLTGEGIISIIGMINLAIIINAIGQDNNGFIIVVQTYALLFNTVFAFKSFQALIKYMSLAMENKDINKIKIYIKQSITLDIGAAVLSVIFGYLLLDYAAVIMKWDYSIKPYIKIFLIASLFYIQGTPVGILRVYNKFNLITYANVICNFIKLILFALGLLLRLGLDYFFAVEVLAFVLPNLILMIYAYNTLKDNGLGDFYKVKSGIDRDFFAFNFYSNITSTIDLPVGYLTTMILNRYLGFSEISVYKTFEKLGSIIGKLGAPLNQIIYPEMSVMIAKKEFGRAKKLSDKLFAGIGLIGIVFIVFVVATHKLWLGIFITNYNEYLIALVLYFGFMVFINATTGVQSLFMALGYMKHNIPILLIINSLYLILMYRLIALSGLSGVILSLFIQAVAVVVVKLIIMRKSNYSEYRHGRHVQEKD